MTSASASPTTLIGLTDSVPPGNTAIIVPEQNLRISYGSLRDNVTALAEALAAAGIERGDRIGMAMPRPLRLRQIVARPARWSLCKGNRRDDDQKCGLHTGGRMAP